MARLAVLFVLIAAGSAACGATRPAEGAGTTFKPPDGFGAAELSLLNLYDRTVEGLSADGIVVEAVEP